MGLELFDVVVTTFRRNSAVDSDVAEIFLLGKFFESVYHAQMVRKHQKFCTVIDECFNKIANTVNFTEPSQFVRLHKRIIRLPDLLIFLPSHLLVHFLIILNSTFQLPNRLLFRLLVRLVNFLELAHHFVTSLYLHLLASLIRQLVQDIFFQASHHVSRHQQVVQLDRTAGTSIVNTVTRLGWLAVTVREISE